MKSFQKMSVTVFAFAVLAILLGSTVCAQFELLQPVRTYLSEFISFTGCTSFYSLFEASPLYEYYECDLNTSDVSFNTYEYCYWCAVELGTFRTTLSNTNGCKLAADSLDLVFSSVTTVDDNGDVWPVEDCPYVLSTLNFTALSVPSNPSEITTFETLIGYFASQQSKGAEPVYASVLPLTAEQCWDFENSTIWPSLCILRFVKNMYWSKFNETIADKVHSSLLNATSNCGLDANTLAYYCEAGDGGDGGDGGGFGEIRLPYPTECPVDAIAEQTTSFSFEAVSEIYDYSDCSADGKPLRTFVANLAKNKNCSYEVNGYIAMWGYDSRTSIKQPCSEYVDIDYTEDETVLALLENFVPLIENTIIEGGSLTALEKVPSADCSGVSFCFQAYVIRRAWETIFDYEAQAEYPTVTADVASLLSNCKISNSSIQICGSTVFTTPSTPRPTTKPTQTPLKKSAAGLEIVYVGIVLGSLMTTFGKKFLK